MPESLLEQGRVRPEVEERLASAVGNGSLRARTLKQDAVVEKAEGRGGLDELLEPIGFGHVVGEHAGFGDVAEAELLDHLDRELSDERIGIRRIQPDTALPRLGETIVLDGEVIGGTHDFVRGRRGSGVEIDDAHESDGPLDNDARRVPLIIGTAYADARSGCGLEHRSAREFLGICRLVDVGEDRILVGSQLAEAAAVVLVEFAVVITSLACELVASPVAPVLCGAEQFAPPKL